MTLVKTVALVGMMGVGKTSIGKRLAVRLDVPFADADQEIEAAAGMEVKEIFAKYGEPEFRRLERSVIARLLAGPPHVLATGGGAFMDDTTRAAMKDAAFTIWLRAPIDVLLGRVQKAPGRRPVAAAAGPGRHARDAGKAAGGARAHLCHGRHGAGIRPTSRMPRWWTRSLRRLPPMGYAKRHERRPSPSALATAPMTSMSAPACWRAPANC